MFHVKHIETWYIALYQECDNNNNNNSNNNNNIEGSADLSSYSAF